MILRNTLLLSCLALALAGCLFMIACGRSSDRQRERRWHLCVPLLMAAGGIAIAGLAPANPALVLGGLYSGFYTPNDAGAVGEAGACEIALARRRLTWRRLRMHQPRRDEFAVIGERPSDENVELRMRRRTCVRHVIAEV